MNEPRRGYPLASGVRQRARRPGATAQAARTQRALVLLPFVPISAVTDAELPGIIKRMEQRLSQRRARRQASLVWASSFILLGLRYSPALAAQLFRGVMSMKESSTYQLILEEGRQEGRQEGRNEGALAEAKKVLRLIGEEAFGPPDAQITAHMERLNDLTKLEDLLRRMVTAGSWQELFARPTPGSRKRKAP